MDFLLGIVGADFVLTVADKMSLRSIMVLKNGKDGVFLLRSVMPVHLDDCATSMFAYIFFCYVCMSAVHMGDFVGQAVIVNYPGSHCRL